MMISRRMRLTGNVARMRKEMNAYRLFVGPRSMWVDNIKMVLEEIGWGAID
jgi:hypothetical protein